MLTPEEIKRRAALFMDGKSDEEAAEILCISEGGYKNWRVKNKLFRSGRGHRKVAVDYRLADKLLADGYPVKYVAIRCGCSPENIYRYRKWGR